jgi:hypothetical protein
MRLLHREVKTEPGCAVYVNKQRVDKRPLYVWKEDEVQLVNFAPFFLKVAKKATCQEGVPVEMTSTIRLELSPEDGALLPVLANAGYRTYKDPLRVSAQSVAEYSKLAESLGASLETFIRKTEFFTLLQQQAATQAQLDQVFQLVFRTARVSGAVASLEANAVEPDERLLADLAARAKMTDEVKDAVRTRVYEDAALGAIVDYFLDSKRQKELLRAYEGLAKAEGERAIVEAQQQIIRAQNDLKIVQAEEEHRRAKRQAELDAEEGTWTNAAMERNAKIKAKNAEYEFEYKTRRAAEEMQLAQKDGELAKMKEEAVMTLRNGRGADLALKVKHETDLMRIRVEEQRQSADALGSVLARVKDMPVAGYQGVQNLTLFNAGGGELQDPVKSLLLVLLNRLGDAAVRLAKPSGADSNAVAVTQD